MNKVIRDDAVAVLYSPGFGAGWYTWNESLSLVFDPILVELVDKMNDDNRHEFIERIQKRAEELNPDGYFGGAIDLTIRWLPVGTKFIIEEYDGAESIRLLDDTNWIIA